MVSLVYLSFIFFFAPLRCCFSLPIHAAQPGIHTRRQRRVVIICWHLVLFLLFLLPYETQSLCSLLVRHERPYSLAVCVFLYCRRNMVYLGTVCNASNDQESNRCCIYIALHLAWVFFIISTIRNIWTRRSNIPCKILLLLLLFWFFCYSLAFHSFSVIRFFFSMFVHSLFCFVPISVFFLLFFEFSFHFILQCCVCEFATCSLLLCLVRRQRPAIVRPDDSVCFGRRICCRRRVIFIFVSHSIRVVGYSIQCCSR